MGKMRFDYARLAPRVARLGNGIPLYMFPDPELDLVRLEFVFDAGSYFQQKPMQAGACCALLGAGTENYSADSLSEELDFYGAYLERYSDRDQACLTFYSLGRYFEQILPFCEEAVKRSCFPQSELETYLRKQHRKFQVDLQRVANLARREFYPMVFGKDHPYGRVVEESDFSNLRREDVRSFYKRQYVAENCHIVLAGAFSDMHVRIIDRLFGGTDWVGEKADLEAGRKMTALEDRDRMRIVASPGSLQAAVMCGMPVFRFDSPDFAPFKVVDYVLGGYFGSRLMRNIREEKGYTYGISSYVVPLRYMPVWAVSSEVKADCASKVIAEVEKEIRKLQEEEISREELELVQNAYMGDFMQELDGTFDLAERMKLFILMGVDSEFYRHQEEVLFSITPSRIREYAVRFLAPERFSTVVVGASDL